MAEPALTQGSLIHQAISHHARHRPRATAIDADGLVLTYGQLDEKMHRLGAELLDGGLDRGAPVLMVMDNGLEACVGMSGILRADGCYVPILPSLPVLRAAQVIAQIVPAFVLTLTQHLEYVAHAVAEAGLTARPVVIVLDDGVVADPQPAFRAVVTMAQWDRARHCPEQKNIDEDLAYILFTSGTTGQPKGVMVSHRSVGNFLGWAAQCFGYGPDDRFSNHSSITFDLSVLDIWGAFRVGGTVCPIIKAADRTFPAKFIRDRRITVWFSVPGVITMLRKARQLSAGALNGNLRLALFCGEAMSAGDAAAWLQTHPDIPIYNLYGPTEATIACTYHQVTADNFDPRMNVPIGRPVAATEIVIMGEDNKPVAAGITGRLTIGGVQLATGYWRRPDLTAAAFPLNPLKPDMNVHLYETGDLARFDEQGVLHFLGRRDSQVKVMGFRVELGDVEATLNACPGIEEAVALFIPESQEIVAIVGDSDKSADDGVVLTHCTDHLPGYMVPKRIERFAHLPRNANGKLDRAAAAALLLTKNGAKDGQG